MTNNTTAQRKRTKGQTIPQPKEKGQKDKQYHSPKKKDKKTKQYNSPKKKGDIFWVQCCCRYIVRRFRKAFLPKYC